MLFRQIADPELAQYAYIIGCQQTGEALLIDPERDVERYIEVAEREGLTISGVAETHIHADFLSGSRELASRMPVTVYLSDEGSQEWKYEWANRSEYKTRFLRDGDTFSVGRIEVGVVHTPGHTPEHLSYLVTDVGGGASSPMGLVSGDFVFVGDLGRPDLLDTAAGMKGTQEPAANDLYRSVKHFLQLEDHLQVWPGHGAGSSCGRALGAVPSSTVGYERLFNSSIQPAMKSPSAFVTAILDAQPEPPPYFARMKALNKLGPVVLGQLPKLERLSPGKASSLFEKGAVPLDTISDRAAFMDSHLTGSLFAPLGSYLQVVAGSYLDPETQVILIGGDQDADSARASLLRIGVDNVVGYLAREDLGSAGPLTSTTRLPSFEAAFHEISHADGLVLDVRGAAEFRRGHIPGAINIAHTRLNERLNEISKDKTVFVHCQSGQRAAFAVALLERKGFEVVHVDGSLDLVEAA